MKKFISLSALFLLFSFSIIAQENAEETGYDGDHFSLEGALDLFKKSASLEDFEKRLNEEENYVNNLDLNEDGDIDYIRIEDKQQGNTHAIILQVPLNENERQDIAVIEIEQTGKETAMLQIIGDEAVYGEQKIVEPFEVESSRQEGRGPNAEYDFRLVIVNVYFWRPVRFIYTPAYRPYVSPYRWRVYPRWWQPWNPRPFRLIYPQRVRFQRNYHVVTVHRVATAHRIYTPYRRTSTAVVRRTSTVRVTRKANGGKVVRRKTTTVKKKNGKVVGAKRSKTAVRKNKAKKVKRNRRN